MWKKLLDRFLVFPRRKLNAVQTSNRGENDKKEANVIRTFYRPENDNLLLAKSFENGLQFLIDNGFIYTRPFSQVAYGTLLLRYTGPFNVDVERDDRLEVSVYIDPLYVDKPPTMRKIGIPALIFLASGCTENIMHLFWKFWDPLDYEESARLICGKFQEHFEKIAWLMREENVSSVYQELDRKHTDFMRTIDTSSIDIRFDHSA